MKIYLPVFKLLFKLKCSFLTIALPGGLGLGSPILGQDLAIENERRHEFAWEGLYWPDLVRTNRAVPVLNSILPAEYNKTMDINQTIYPIPRSEIQIAPGLYDQNPGY